MGTWTVCLHGIYYLAPTSGNSDKGLVALYATISLHFIDDLVFIQ